MNSSVSLLKKEQELYKTQKKHYHSYLSGDQKFERKFLLNTYFEIEANERNSQQIEMKNKRKMSENAHPVIDPITAKLKAMKQKSLEEDLKAFGQISDTAFFKFSEKLTLYNDYSTTFICEPKNLTRTFLKLKKFRLANWKKTMPMSAYVRRMKTAYNREGENWSPYLKPNNVLEEEPEEKEERLKKNVIDAFMLTKKQKNNKGFIISLKKIKKIENFLKKLKNMFFF